MPSSAKLSDVRQFLPLLLVSLICLLALAVAVPATPRATVSDRREWWSG